jgi:hypothetical protein
LTRAQACHALTALTALRAHRLKDNNLPDISWMPDSANAIELRDGGNPPMRTPQ